MSVRLSRAGAGAAGRGAFSGGLPAADGIRGAPARHSTPPTKAAVGLHARFALGGIGASPTASRRRPERRISRSASQQPTLPIRCESTTTSWPRRPGPVLHPAIEPLRSANLADHGWSAPTRHWWTCGRTERAQDGLRAPAVGDGARALRRGTPRRPSACSGRPSKLRARWRRGHTKALAQLRFRHWLPAPHCGPQLARQLRRAPHEPPSGRRLPEAPAVGLRRPEHRLAGRRPARHATAPRTASTVTKPVIPGSPPS